MMMENAGLLDNERDFMGNDKLDKQYTIIFEGGDLDWDRYNCCIPVSSRREAELLLLCLGEEASVIMDQQACRLYPDVSDWLHHRTDSEIFSGLKWSYREEDEVMDIIEKIPLPKDLGYSLLKIDRNDPEPDRIDREYVHKLNNESVLISKPYHCGNMYYFNGFKNSAEFSIDHGSDHLEGIIIFEIARQAGIASAHLEGMPFSGAIVIVKTSTRYQKFIESGQPYLIRTIPAYKQKGGVGFCVYQIIQNGKSCVIGYFSVIAYNTKNAYHKFRNSRIIERVSSEKIVNMRQTVEA
jgi:hypothetical protein